MKDLEMQLCNEEFLNLDEIWYTSQPNFSRCFRDTFLVWLPAFSFIVLLSSEIYGIHRTRLKGKRHIPYNKFNLIRLLFVFALFCMKISQLISYVQVVHLESGTSNGTIIEPSMQYEASISAIHTLALSALLMPIIQSLSYLILGITYCMQRKAGIHTSGPIWFYLFTAVICSSIDYYAVITTPLANNLISDVDYMHFPTLLILFLLECHGDAPQLELDSTQNVDDGVRPTNPQLYSSFCSRITFWWFNKFLLFGYKNKMRLCDLWKTMPRDKSSELTPVFCKAWLETKSKDGTTYLSADGKVQQSNDTMRVLIRLFAPELLVAASFRLVHDMLQYVTPCILKAILAHLKSDSYQWHGLLLAALLMIVPTLQSILVSNHSYRVDLIGLQTRTVIIGAVYRKSLLLSGSSRLQSTSGEIVNLMSVDASRFQNLLLSANMFWSVPLQMTLAIVLLYRELGWPIFAGVICMVMLLPFNSYIANKIQSNQVGLMRVKDEKVRQLDEIFSGIRVIKLYAWENSFMESCLNFRNVELGFLGKILTLDAVQVFLWSCSPFLVACVTFCVYVSIDKANVLDAEKAFVSISLFNLLRFPLSNFPQLVTSFMLTKVSAQRLNKFLNSDELVEYVTREDDSNAITIKGATMAWTSLDAANSCSDSDSKINKINLEPQVTLRDINLQVRPGSFVAIVGQVASGKTSLISSILGEMHRISGRFNIGRSLKLAYVPQRAFIQNLSVRGNILFGSPYNEQRYKRTLASCSLLDDLDILPGGDEAEIGEKGINLSGGQKQRVSLARACYSDSDIILLDDPLSALDSHVAKLVFDEVLSSTSGMLRGKTRVLATNSLFVLPHVDHIVVLEGGRVVESGSYQELMRNENGNLAEIMRQYNANQEDQTNEATKDQDTNETVQTPSAIEKTGKVDTMLKPAIKTGPTSEEPLGKLVSAEKMEEGNVGLHVYVAYFIRSYTPSRLSIVIIGLSTASGFNVATNVWLSLWASDAEDPVRSEDTSLRTMRMLVYALFGALQCLIILLSSLALYRAGLRGAKKFHTSLLEAVMHSPMTFFDTTPIGRVVNRFAKDIDIIDSLLPCTFRSFLNTLTNILSTLFLICYIFPSLLILMIPLTCVNIIVQRIFIVTTRQLKRMESVTRSPIYSNFSETLSGISTIRAYNCVGRFIDGSDSAVDRNQSCSYPNIIATKWLSIRLEFFANLISSSVAVFAVLNRISPGTAGLAISFSLMITVSLGWFVLMSSELETHIVSVERVLDYMKNEQEDKWVKENSRPPAGWPTAGAITFRQYSTRYRKDMELVLRDVNVEIKAGEKVGVVGRTGSGKSSLSLSLFRILERATGSIDIDSLDITRLGLHDIRSRLTIIPQDPVLFSGTLRFNLDPLKLNSDLDIWRALELAHLRPHINKFGSGLEYQVSEYGENFSVGQRQLICLARAILRKTKILVLDEATASVDQETDAVVQKTIREVFKDCTIITIAHRLNTILDSDRIIVLDAGRILELGAPDELIQNTDSAFLSLVRDAGIDVSQLRANSAPSSMTKL